MMNEEDARSAEKSENPLEATAEASDAEHGAAPASDIIGDERGLFAFMARHPFPFLVVLPAALAALVAVGWSQEDKVEQNVANLWIPTRTQYYQDKLYQAKYTPTGTIEGRNRYTIFAAMAVGRDGENLFTESRLREVGDRMAALENTTVQYKGQIFTWDDLCASNSLGIGTTYKFPCARLSSLDYWQETRSTLKETHRLTWYDTIYDEVVRPRVPRFGIVLDFCPDECEHEVRLRTDADYAVDNGYDASYANPLGIFADIGDLEESNQCKICIEVNFEEHMINMTRDTTAVFQLLGENLQRVADEGGEGSERAIGLLEIVSNVVPQINRSSVEDFYRYFNVRRLYGELGSAMYQTEYNSLFRQFGSLLTSDNFGCNTCDLPENVTLEQSELALLRHADNAFSSVNTAGAPLPLWNPKSGYLLDPVDIEPGELGPYGGSGIDLSGGPTKGVPLQSAQYFGLDQSGEPSELLNPFDDAVLYDPVVRWFMAGGIPFTTYCGNKPMPADRGNSVLYTALMETRSSLWCTKFNDPYLTNGTRTIQHFARMWYDMLTNSPNFLNLTQGVSDPYVWTTGQGCGYTLAGERPRYTNQTDSVILTNASMELYYVDEGEVIGVLDRNILIGGTRPEIGSYNYSHPLDSVRLIQNVYLALVPGDIVGRVKNCNRPGGPINDLSVEDAETVLYQFKKSFEEAWSEGWDDPNSGEVQMIGFFDDTGVGGSTARMLEQVTLSSGTLMTISFIIIILFSVIFLASFDVIQSRILVTLVGVSLVILSFFAAIGLAILIGIKINVTIGWTLPFVVVGLGVDDMYIISLALKNNGGTSMKDFNTTMKEVSIPVTLTSLVNFCMFAVMNLSDIPAAYKTAQAAMLCVAFLWLTIMLCFPAYCYLDMKRQEAGRVDVLFCFKSKSQPEAPESSQQSFGILYNRVYKPLMIADGCVRTATHIFVWVAALGLLAVGIYGSVHQEVGLGLEDFFSTESQTGKWAEYRSKYLGSWNLRMNWGALDYGDPGTQLKMMQQFEGVVSSDFVSEIDTKQLWIADFSLWTSRHCSDNFVRRDASQRECGRDFGCVGTWEKNNLNLRLKQIDRKTCQPRTGGICRHTADMHPEDLADLASHGKYNQSTDDDSSWCPVFDAKTDGNLQQCIERWRDYADGVGGFLVEPNTATESATCKGDFYNNDTILFPVPISGGPLMFGIHMQTHEDTIHLIQEARSWCDDEEELHCWMSGIPFDYWEQYIYVDSLLYGVFGVSIAVGFFVAAAFLFAKISLEHEHPFCQILTGSIVGALLIIFTCVLSTVTVIGLSSLFGVSLTAFSAMSFVLSVGFVVEYSVHIIHRFITAPMNYKNARERVEYSMSFLFLPTFMAFISSTIGVVCLAFSEFQFNTVYFFRPLMTVMFVTYFFGCFFLPALLTLIEFDFLKLGHHSSKPTNPAGQQDSTEVHQSLFKNETDKNP